MLRYDASTVKAGLPTLRDAHWIAAQWDTARLLADAAGAGGALLVLDEVQKVAS